jgi:hypothetical protein
MAGDTQESESTWTSRDKELVAALGLRSYHLPGNNWCQDWFQYFANNHPIFGICCHHKLHPVGGRMRIINLFGSIVFGLCVTNMIWLWFLYSEEDANTAVVTISLGSFSWGAKTNNATISADVSDSSNSSNDTTKGQDIQIAEDMVLLWTVGGGLHALFDNTIWCVSACVCCLPGRPLQCLGKYRWCGGSLVVLQLLQPQPLPVLW